MKNKILRIIGFSLLALVSLFFAALVGSLFWQAARSAPLRPFDYSEIFFAVKLTFLTATTATVLSVVFALPIGYVLSRFEFPGKSFIETLLILPLVISPIALGAMLLIFFNTPVGKAIESSFGPVVFTKSGIVVAQFVVVAGLAITLTKAIFDFVDREYENISRTLGADELRTFFRITIPISARGLVATAVLVWARAVGEFGATVTLAGATIFKTETLPVAIFLSLSGADVYQSAVLTLLAIAMALGALFFLRLIYAKNRKP